MPWIPQGDTELTGYSAKPVQIPFFQSARINLGSNETFAHGYCLGHLLCVGPSLVPSFGGVMPGGYLTALPARLTALRVRVARTGPVAAANLVATIWHTNYDGSDTSVHSAQPQADFGSILPDASGVYPLSALPLVDALDNNTCFPPEIPQIEITLDTPVSFGDVLPTPYYPFWLSFLTLSIDDGFSTHSNIVIGAAAHSTGYASYVSDNLNFIGPFGVDTQWWEAPICVQNPPSYLLASALDGLDLFLDPLVTGRRSRSWAAVIG